MIFSTRNLKLFMISYLLVWELALLIPILNHLIVFNLRFGCNIVSRARIFNNGFSSILFCFLTLLDFLSHSIRHASYLHLTWTFLWLFLYFYLRRTVSIRMLARLPCNWIFSYYVQGHHIGNYTNWSSIQEWMNDFWGVIICSSLTLLYWRFLKRCRITNSFE